MVRPITPGVTPNPADEKTLASQQVDQSALAGQGSSEDKSKSFAEKVAEEIIDTKGLLTGRVTAANTPYTDPGWTPEREAEERKVNERLEAEERAREEQLKENRRTNLAAIVDALGLPKNSSEWSPEVRSMLEDEIGFLDEDLLRPYTVASSAVEEEPPNSNAAVPTNEVEGDATADVGETRKTEEAKGQTAQPAPTAVQPIPTAVQPDTQNKTTAPRPLAQPLSPPPDLNEDPKVAGYKEQLKLIAASSLEQLSATPQEKHSSVIANIKKDIASLYNSAANSGVDPNVAGSLAMEVLDNLLGIAALNTDENSEPSPVVEDSASDESIDGAGGISVPESVPESNDTASENNGTTPAVEESGNSHQTQTTVFQKEKYDYEPKPQVGETKEEKKTADSFEKGYKEIQNIEASGRIRHEYSIYEEMDTFWHEVRSEPGKYFEGYYVDKNGEEHWDSVLHDVYVLFCDTWGIPQSRSSSRDFFFSQAIKFLGVGLDRKGNLFGKKPGENKIPVATVAIAVHTMKDNIDEGHLPFEYINQSIELYNTKCYPMPFLSDEELGFYASAKGPFKFKTKREILTAQRELWFDIYRRIAWTEKNEVLKSYETSMRYFAETYEYGTSNGGDKVKLNIQDWGVRPIKLDLLSEKQHEYAVKAKEISPGLSEVIDKVNDASDRFLIHVAKTNGQKASRKKLRKHIQDNDFEPIICQTHEEKLAMKILESTGDVVCALSIVGDVALAGSGTAEAAIGTADMRGQLWFRRRFWSEDERQEFFMSDTLKAYAHSNEVNDALSAVVLIDGSFGRLAAQEYLKSNTVYNLDTANQWVTKTFGERGSVRLGLKASREDAKIRRALKSFHQSMVNIQTGQWLTRGSDGMFLLDNFLANERNLQKSGAELYFNTEALEAAFDQDAQKTIRDILLTKEGNQAFNLSSLRTLSGNSLVAARYERWAQEHGFAHNLTRLFFTHFPGFLLNATSRLNPLLHTTQLLSLQLRSKVNNRDLTEQDLYEMLSADEFGQALKLDLLRVPGCMARIAVCMAIYAALGGIEPPDDENKKKHYDEWRIGVQYDEDGNPIIGSGVTARTCWYMYDILGWAGPLSIAAFGWATGKMDLDLAIAVLKDGMADTVFDLAPGKFVDLIQDFDEASQMAGAISYDPTVEGEDEVVLPENAIDYWGALVGISALNWVTESFTPRVINDFLGSGFGPYFYAVNPNMIYTPTDEDHPEATMYNPSYTDRYIRQLSQRNIGLGLIMNLASGFYSNETGTQKTGYTIFDQPIQKEMGPVNYFWYSQFDVCKGYYKDGEWFIEGDEDKIMTMIEDVWFGQVAPKIDSGADATALGICMPDDSRYCILGYCYWQSGKVTDAWRNGDITYEEFVDQKGYWQNQIDILNDYDFVSYPIMYGQWNTDFQKLYTTEGGEDVSEFEYTLRNAPLIRQICDAAGVPEIDVEYQTYGTFSNGTHFLAAKVENLFGTYDFQTPCAWFGEDTDMDTALALIASAGGVFTSGPYEGEKVVDVISGYGQAINPDGSFTPVIGKRAYTPLEDVRRWEYDIDPTQGSFWMPAGEETPDCYKTTASTGSGWNNYSYGGGGSYSSKIYSSNPKIYSNPRSVNADRAATMYSKTPYTANRTYLRPAFYTKGSREAYRRQDM